MSPGTRSGAHAVLFVTYNYFTITLEALLPCFLINN